MVKIKFHGTIKSVEHIIKDQTDKDVEYWKLIIRQEDGFENVVYTTDQELKGFKSGDLVQIVIDTDQTILEGK